MRSNIWKVFTSKSACALAKRFVQKSNLVSIGKVQYIHNYLIVKITASHFSETLIKKFINPNQPSKMSQKGVDKMQEQFVLVGK
jgi:hypothetical protein